MMIRAATAVLHVGDKMELLSRCVMHQLVKVRGWLRPALVRLPRCFSDFLIRDFDQHSRSPSILREWGEKRRKRRADQARGLAPKLPSHVVVGLGLVTRSEAG
jgi:hypothetical protein